ncbi:MAG: 50S ribosomal protein L18e [Candidatus Nanoarchaeia archaeon]
MRRTGPTNVHLKALIRDLRKLSRKENVNVWRRVASELAKPTRSRREVNLFTINLSTNDKETVIVPGKVLGEGELERPVSVAAFRFSESAKQKIIKAGGKVLTIQDVMKSNPKGKDVRILG